MNHIGRSQTLFVIESLSRIVLGLIKLYRKDAEI